MGSHGMLRSMRPGLRCNEQPRCSLVGIARIVAVDADGNPNMAHVTLVVEMEKKSGAQQRCWVDALA